MFLDISKEKNTIFITGTGRSGTTWLSEIINFQNDHRYMFEPFHTKRVKILKKWNHRQYINPVSHNDNFLIPSEKIVRGKIRNRWVDQFNPQKFIFKKRLIKDIRTNLLIRWLNVNFPEIKIVYMLRNPFAVAHSKTKLKWETDLSNFLNQEELMSDFLNPFKRDIINAGSSFERHMFFWCIENYIPLKQFNENEVYIIFYENLCTDFEDEVKKLFLFLDITFDKNVLVLKKKASALSREDSPVVTGKDLLNDWKNYIDRDEISRGMEILSIFGLDSIYSDDPFPLIKSSELLKRSLYSNY